jgi:DNA-binding MarR family transcriptional regulator
MNNPEPKAGVNGFALPGNPGRPMLLIRQTLLAIKPAFEQVLGMPPLRVIVTILLEAEGEISQAEIQKRLGVDRALITRLVKQMEADGWVLRRTSPADNRYTLVRLSEMGFDQHLRILKKIDEIETSLMGDMNEEEIACLQHGLMRIRENAEKLVQGVKIGSEFLAEDIIFTN